MRSKSGRRRTRSVRGRPCVTLRRPRSAASAPSPGVASGRYGRSSLTFERGSRVSSCGGACLAGMCASPWACGGISIDAPGESGRILNGSRRRDAVSTREVCVTVLRPSAKASRTRRSRLGFLPSFPHLWKTLWKSAAEHTDPLKMACFARSHRGEAVPVGSCSDVFAGGSGIWTEV